jgi:putative ABC transport system permease protein
VVIADDAPAARVVGVVEDVVLRDPWNAHGGCVSLRFGWVPDERQARYLVRARPGQRPAALVALRTALGGSGLDRRVEVAPFDRETTYPVRLARGLVITLAVFGAVVALIALLGALTVSSFLVRERTRSIGIRRALGAQPGDIIRYFLVETSVLTAAGLATGLVFMGGVFLLMQQLYPGLYLGWKPLALTALVLWLGALAGALMAAQRAARIPPWSATRSV